MAGGGGTLRGFVSPLCVDSRAAPDSSLHCRRRPGWIQAGGQAGCGLDITVWINC